MERSKEDYLEAILVLSRQKAAVRAVDVVRYTGHSKSSVSAAMSLLRQAGLLGQELGSGLQLTERGQREAERVYHKHCVLKRFLMECGVCAETAEQDACRLEHAISSESLACLEAHLLAEPPQS